MLKRHYPSQCLKDIIDEGLAIISNYAENYLDQFDQDDLVEELRSTYLTLEIIDPKVKINMSVDTPKLFTGLINIGHYMKEIYDNISSYDLLSKQDSSISGTIRHSDGTVLYSIDIEYDGTVYWLKNGERRRERSMTKSEYDSEMDELQDQISDENSIPELELLRSYLRDITKSVEDVWDRVNTYTGSNDLKDVLDLVNKLREKVGTHTNTFKKICVSKVEKEK